MGDFAIRSGGAVRLLTAASDETFAGRRSLLERLALIDGDSDGDLVPLLEGLSPSSHLMVILPEGDLRGLGLVGRVRSSWGWAALVVLRGPAAGRRSAEIDGPSLVSPVLTVESWPDDIPATLRRLGRTSRYSGRPEATATL